MNNVSQYGMKFTIIKYDYHTVLYHMIYDSVSNNTTVSKFLLKIINFDFHTI